ncbi:RNA polymerase sigma factor [Legionella genomosp. 1]|uniref:RNA polymerase sigma factor n=1 Tax=Legionella genomosp. 1 TaxID=1093625 RepID=UPI0013EF848A|nr:RNA polymerase sigma factor [Legionella genomosp. 1]
MDDIIQSALRGDEASLNALIRACSPGLKALLQPMVDEATAADIIQEVWLSVFTHLQDFKQKSHFKTWLYRIAINQAKTHLKSAWIKKVIPDSNDDFDVRFDAHGSWNKIPESWGMESPESLLEQEELSLLIQTNIERLPHQQRLVFIMHDIEQIEFKDICAMLELSQSNVFVLLHRARKALYAQIDHFFLTGKSK